MIEEAKSGRAKCRKCKKTIKKGEPRFGYEDFYEDHATYRWHHVICGAAMHPKELQEALADTDVDIPDRDKVDKAIQDGIKKKSKTKGVYPYAEIASSGRSSCMQCEEKIPKDEFRVAVEREVDTGSFSAKRPGYLHPKCAVAYTGEDKKSLSEQLEVNSGTLEADEVAALLKAL